MGAKTLRQGLKFPEAPLGLPGFCSGRFADTTGYLVVTRDWEGRITSGQFRPRGEKYCWLKSSHLPCDEIPLQVLRGDPAKPVFLIEGTAAKPWMVVVCVLGSPPLMHTPSLDSLKLLMTQKRTTCEFDHTS